MESVLNCFILTNSVWNNSGKNISSVNTTYRYRHQIFCSNTCLLYTFTTTTLVFVTNFNLFFGSTMIPRRRTNKWRQQALLLFYWNLYLEGQTTTTRLHHDKISSFSSSETSEETNRHHQQEHASCPPMSPPSIKSISLSTTLLVAWRHLNNQQENRPKGWCA